MKGNKAPKYLYVDTNDRLSDSILYGFTKKQKADDIEYIRTDAFFEKAEKAMIEWAGTYISKTTGGGVRERKVLATDLLNYFRKYMKGE